MNFSNFNPSMLNNIDLNQMKMASDMMAGMSDEQLRSYSKMMGMPNMDPQMMRNNINMMKNMNSNQFETVKNNARNFAPPAGNAASGNDNQYQRQASAPQQTIPTTTKYSRIENLKSKGNDFFKQGKYEDASSSYFEAIIEIEELRSNNKKLKDDELDTLEISCRLNYANVKAKEEDFDIVLSQARQVLNIKENGKAYFRLGQAQYHLKKYEDAVDSLERAIPMLPGDATVPELRDKAKKALQAKKGGVQEEPELQSKNNEQEKSEDVRNEENEQKEEPKTKLKKKNAPKVDNPPLPTKPKEERHPEPERRERPREEVKIEEEKVQPTAAPRQEANRSSGFGQNVSEEQMKQSQEQLGNMSSDQLRGMTDMFKNMDNTTLRSMLKAQMGMDISDSQLESMKMMMTPEMLQNVSKMDMSQMPKAPFQRSASQPASSQHNCADHGHDHDHGHGHQHSHQTQTQASPTGAMPSMDFKLEQAMAMMDMMIQNPDMIKNMVGMLGEGNPIANFVKNRSPQDLAKYLKALRGCMKVYAKVSPLMNFLRKYWQIIAGIAVGYFVLRMLG